MRQVDVETLNTSYCLEEINMNKRVRLGQRPPPIVNQSAKIRSSRQFADVDQKSLLPKSDPRENRLSIYMAITESVSNAVQILEIRFIYDTITRYLLRLHE